MFPTFLSFDRVDSASMRHMRTLLTSKLSISWRFVKERRPGGHFSGNSTDSTDSTAAIELQALEDQKAEADRCLGRAIEEVQWLKDV